MSQKYKSVKITTKDGTKSKYVDLYYILKDAGIPRKALDPKIWDIPEGFYAMETRPYVDTIRLREDYNENPPIHLDILFAYLYPIKEGEEIPKEALDPEIWDIPIGYYATRKPINSN